MACELCNWLKALDDAALVSAYWCLHTEMHRRWPELASAGSGSVEDAAQKLHAILATAGKKPNS